MKGRGKIQYVDIFYNVIITIIRKPAEFERFQNKEFKMSDHHGRCLLRLRTVANCTSLYPALGGRIGTNITFLNQIDDYVTISVFIYCSAHSNVYLPNSSSVFLCFLLFRRCMNLCASQTWLRKRKHFNLSTRAPLLWFPSKGRHYFDAILPPPNTTTKYC